jgi:hypothetical protein
MKELRGDSPSEELYGSIRQAHVLHTASVVCRKTREKVRLPAPLFDRRDGGARGQIGSACLKDRQLVRIRIGKRTKEKGLGDGDYGAYQTQAERARRDRHRGAAALR